MAKKMEKGRFIGLTVKHTLAVGDKGSNMDLGLCLNKTHRRKDTENGTMGRERDGLMCMKLLILRKDHPLRRRLSDMVFVI